MDYVLAFLYAGSYTVLRFTTDEEVHMHTDIYIAADYLGIDALKVVAVGNLVDMLKTTGVHYEQLTRVLETLYEHTHVKEREGILGTLLDTVYTEMRRSPLLDENAFLWLLENNGDIAVDLLKRKIIDEKSEQLRRLDEEITRYPQQEFPKYTSKPSVNPKTRNENIHS